MKKLREINDEISENGVNYSKIEIKSTENSRFDILNKIYQHYSDKVESNIITTRSERRRFRIPRFAGISSQNLRR